MITISLVLLLAVSSLSAPSPQLPPGIDAATCPNYPFCGAGPAQASPQDAVSFDTLTRSGVRDQAGGAIVARIIITNLHMRYLQFERFIL